jgi:ABC-type dipeptide/oligopeptide/nickel transport system permease subunit
MSTLRTLLADRRARVGGALMGALAILAIAGPFFVGDPAASVAAPLQPPSAAHWLGTTGQGQDVLAQLVCGARATLGVGFVSGALVVAIGATIGAAAGYLGGRTDALLSLLTNVFLVLPGLPLAVVLAAWLPPGPFGLVAVLVLTGWAWNARTIRAQVLALRNSDWVAAARVSGESDLRIILGEILPNLRSLLASAFIGATVYAVAAQVGLEFLGLGDPAAVTWGTMLYWASNDAALLTRSWWTFVPTGVGIAIVGLALTLLNAGLDGVSNRRLGSGGGAVTEVRRPAKAVAA